MRFSIPFEYFISRQKTNQLKKYIYENHIYTSQDIKILESYHEHINIDKLELSKLTITEHINKSHLYYNEACNSNDTCKYCYFISLIHFIPTTSSEYIETLPDIPKKKVCDLHPNFCI